ncbi:MAG: DUF3558 domain-containing protein [Vicinamibacteraceae bacterium]
MRSTHPSTCAGLMLLMVIAIAGLGAAPPPDPCALVTKADAEKLAGEPMQDAGRGPQTCAYGPPEGGLPRVEVYVGDPSQRYLTIEQSQGRKFRTLSGAGDEAFVSDATALLFIKKSDLLVAVRYVTLSDEAEYRKRFEDLARVIAGRI